MGDFLTCTNLDLQEFGLGVGLGLDVDIRKFTSYLCQDTSPQPGKMQVGHG